MEKAYAAAKQCRSNSLAVVCGPAASQHQPAGTAVEPISSAGQGRDMQAAACDSGPAATCPARPDENKRPASVQDAAQEASGRSSRPTSKRGQAAVEPSGMLGNSAACKRASLSGLKAQPAWTQCSSDTNDFTF